MLESFRTSSPARQLALVAGLGAALCVLLALAYFFWFRTSYAVLYSDLRPADAATIVAELERSGTEHRLAEGGRTVLVPEGAVDSARVHIAGQDLPLQGTVGFELFNSSSIGLTEFAQRINLQRALQGELARTIMSIDGVESARVHLSLGEQTAFRGDRRAPRASVSVRTRPGRRLNGNSVRGIQRLVAGSVPEMEYASVAVLNDRGAVVSGEPPAESGNDEQRRIERFFEARIRRALEPRFPADAVEVNVWAALGERAAPPPPEGAARDYRLRATIAIAAPLSHAAHEQVTAAVRDAIAFDDILGDTLSITASPPMTAADDWGGGAAEAGPAAADVARERPRETEPSLLSYLWTPLGLLLLAGILLVLVRRRRAGQAPMGEQERLAYAANLKALLAQGDADAAPRA